MTCQKSHKHHKHHLFIQSKVTPRASFISIDSSGGEVASSLWQVTPPVTCPLHGKWSSEHPSQRLRFDEPCNGLHALCAIRSHKVLVKLHTQKNLGKVVNPWRREARATHGIDRSEHNETRKSTWELCGMSKKAE